MEKDLIKKLENIGFYSMGGKEREGLSEEISRLDREIVRNLGGYYVTFLGSMCRDEECRTLGITVKDSELLRGYVDVFKVYTIREIVGVKEEYDYRMPKEVVPIAESHDGDYICIDGCNGRVYYWNHEEEFLAKNPEKTDVGDYRENMVFIRESAKNFLEGLEINEDYERELQDTGEGMTYEEVLESGDWIDEETYKKMIELSVKYR